MTVIESDIKPLQINKKDPYKFLNNLTFTKDSLTDIGKYIEGGILPKDLVREVNLSSKYLSYDASLAPRYK